MGNELGFFHNQKRIQDFSEIIKSLQSWYDVLNENLEKLKAENKYLRDQHYKDSELAKMDKKVKEAEARAEKARKEANYGFSLSKEEIKSALDWQSRHDKEEHSNPLGYHGAIGGQYSFTFTPTSIGTTGICFCSTCKRRALEAGSKNGTFDLNEYNKYLTEHNGSFVFQELD